MNETYKNRHTTKFKPKRNDLFEKKTKFKKKNKSNALVRPTD